MNQTLCRRDREVLSRCAVSAYLFFRWCQYRSSAGNRFVSKLAGRSRRARQRAPRADRTQRQVAVAVFRAVPELWVCPSFEGVRVHHAQLARELARRSPSLDLPTSEFPVSLEYACGLLPRVDLALPCGRGGGVVRDAAALRLATYRLGRRHPRSAGERRPALLEFSRRKRE